MIVATAGHIDHGKTALVRALTGVDTDRLPEEKARGISIDLGFAYCKTNDGATIGFVDVPGHERFVRNMLAGVCGVDYVMLVVAADDGVMPQTVEHLNIVNLLALSRGVGVVTKIDRVSAARTDEVVAALKALVAPTALAGIEVLPVSALTGQGMDRLRETLFGAARSHYDRMRQGRQFRFVIDRAFSVAGSGTVVTGTVFDGAVKPGDRLLLSPSATEVRVRGLQKDGKAAQEAGAGERCALNLTGVDYLQVMRGDWVIHPALHAPTQRMDVRIHVLPAETQALKHWTPVHLHLGARDVTARVAIRRGAAIQPGQSALAQLIVDQPIVALSGDRFILRDQSALRTLGGGAVVDAFAPRQRFNPELRKAQLEALEKGDPATVLAALVRSTPHGVDLDHFARSFNLTPEHAERLVRDSGIVVLGKEPRLGLERGLLAAIEKAVVERLQRFHAQSPQQPGMEASALREQCAMQLTRGVFDHLLRHLAEGKRIEFAGPLVRLPRHVATGNPADEATWQRVQPELERADFRGLSVAELALAAKVKEGVLKDFLHRKAATGEVIRVTADRFYLRATLSRFAAEARAAAQAAPQGRFTVAQLRDRTGLGRARTMEILECLDRLRVTQRLGDVRIFRADLNPLP